MTRPTPDQVDAIWREIRPLLPVQVQEKAATVLARGGPLYSVIEATMTVMTNIMAEAAAQAIVEDRKARPSGTS